MIGIPSPSGPIRPVPPYFLATPMCCDDDDERDEEKDDGGEDEAGDEEKAERKVLMVRCHVCGAIVGTTHPGMVECTCGTWFEIYDNGRGEGFST